MRLYYTDHALKTMEYLAIDPSSKGDTEGIVTCLRATKHRFQNEPSIFEFLKFSF